MYKWKLIITILKYYNINKKYNYIISKIFMWIWIWIKINKYDMWFKTYVKKYKYVF